MKTTSTERAAMKKHAQKKGGAESPWQKLMRRKDAAPFENIDALYALDPRLIPIINKYIPGLLHDSFERELSSVVGVGFWLKSPLGYLVPDATDARTDELDGEIRRMIVEEMRAQGPKDQQPKDQGLTDVQIAMHFKQKDERHEMAETRSRAYCVWLVCNPLFCSERDELRRQVENIIHEKGYFPCRPRCVMGIQVTPPFDKSLLPLLRFYNRWGLDRFMTWDLPVPMEPDLFNVSRYEDPGGETGLYLFVPWYLTRDQSLTIRDLRDYSLIPPHLKDWLRPQSTEQKALGYTRSQHMLSIFRNWLALESRYQPQLAGNIEHLDRAFGELLGLGSDSVKKLRLQLEARLSTGPSRAVLKATAPDDSQPLQSPKTKR